VVEGMLGLQAENFAQASWAVATRTGIPSKGRFNRAFDEGEILRTHVLRPTWHFVRPEDIRWLLETTAPRLRRTTRQMQKALEVDDRDLDRAHDVIVDLLSDEPVLTRAALAEGLQARGLRVEGQRLGIILMHAEWSGLICSGPMSGGEQTHTLLESRAPDARQLDRDEALAELAFRYFSGHGPATERDLSYWASLTLTDVRRGLADSAERLDSFEHDGRTFWFSPPALAESPADPKAHILQVLDEYHNGYQDSRYVLDAEGIVPRGRAANTGMVLVDSQMVGGMRRSIGTDGVRFDVNLHREVDENEWRAIDEAAQRYGAFLGFEAKVVAA
jgi:hypothetical protein